jgi:hypothetical protein
VNGSDYADVAVLVLPAFDPENFTLAQRLLRDFLADATRRNKKRLVIDLRGNGGGIIDFGFELFKQLFPTVEPYGAARYRAHDAIYQYSAALADLAVNGTDQDGKTSDEFDDADNGIQTPFLWSNILDENLQPYETFNDYYGPETLNGDNFTSVRRYNVSLCPTPLPPLQHPSLH